MIILTRLHTELIALIDQINVPTQTHDSGIVNFYVIIATRDINGMTQNAHNNGLITIRAANYGTVMIMVGFVGIIVGLLWDDSGINVPIL